MGHHLISGLISGLNSHLPAGVKIGVKKSPPLIGGLFTPFSLPAEFPVAEALLVWKTHCARCGEATEVRTPVKSNGVNKPRQPRKQRGFERVVQYLARAA